MVNRVPGRQRAAGHQEASARIASELASVNFPASRDDIANRIGDRRVPLKEGVDITIREMLEHVRDADFKTFSKARNALEAHWQVYRADKGLQEPPQGVFNDPGQSGR